MINVCNLSFVIIKFGNMFDIIWKDTENLSGKAGETVKGFVRSRCGAFSYLFIIITWKT